MQSSCCLRSRTKKLHGCRTTPLRLSYVWLCVPRVLLEIRVTNVYNLSFLNEMALQTCKTKIQHKTDTLADSNNDTSLGGRPIIVRSPCDCRTMTAQYPCHFTGTARASCGDLAIAVRGPYDHRKSLRTSCDFFVPKRPAKTLSFPHDRGVTTPQCPYGDRAMLLRRVYGLRFYDFKFFV